MKCFSPIPDLLSVCLLTSNLLLFLLFFHKLSDDFLVSELVSFKKNNVQFDHFYSYHNVLLMI